jgi:hypothetical protein
VKPPIGQGEQVIARDQDRVDERADAIHLFEV